MSDRTGGVKLVDYIRWMGGFDFNTYAFREADALVLCVISYFDLNPVFAGRKTAYVRECIPMIDAGEAKICITGGDMGNTEIFEAAAKSKRFGSLSMTDYEDIIDQEQSLQFSAVTFHDEDRFSFLAFRGTDSTLTGWKEDFMISFTQTLAQKMSVDYAERVFANDAAKDLYIGGHSKGGNQALYAACMLSDDLWARITRVFLLDGPGFCPEVLDVSLIKKIDPKAIKIIPEHDIIGKLFEPKITNTIIVESYRIGFMQHSLASWLIAYGDLAALPVNDPASVLISDTITSWVSDIPQEDRPKFVEELFDALGAGGKNSLDDMGPEDLWNALVSFRETSDMTKNTLKDLPHYLWQEVKNLIGLSESEP
ncbi:MAG: DUF2974 domain-containing protein [Lachnospiraceae bacterium]|nr:DUF2974 domain-containing protein [Lachnospiraceae bacterium]